MNPQPRILVVEDELPLRRVLRDCLERHAYRVLLSADGENALEKAFKEKPDLILLDIMMPKLDGFAVCAELRRLNQALPILFLTAKSRVEDRVAGLDAGADDYLIKPFSREELLARIRALLRRNKRRTNALTIVTLGEVVIDFIQQKAVRAGYPLGFTVKEFAMLRLFCECPGEIITRDRFLDIVWGYTAYPTTRTVDIHILNLRRKIEENPDQPRWITTAYGIGYRLEPPNPSAPMPESSS